MRVSLKQTRREYILVGSDAASMPHPVCFRDTRMALRAPSHLQSINSLKTPFNDLKIVERAIIL
jgi:hypothetical protein